MKNYAPSLRSSDSSAYSFRRSPPPSPIGNITFLQHESLRFIINDCPTDNNLGDYIAEFQKHQVTDLVRACEPTYSDHRLLASGIKVHDMRFEDGGVPSDAVIKQFMAIVRDRVDDKEECAIAVHCVAGLGRAPVLVAIALIEFGMERLDAIDFVRKRRRGAFNSRQVQFLDTYKKRQGKLAIGMYFKKLFLANKQDKNDVLVK